MQVLLRGDGLLGAENRKRSPFAVAGYLRYKCSPVGIERAHNMVAQFWNYRADFILQRRDFIGGSVLEVNCNWHGRLTSFLQNIRLSSFTSAWDRTEWLWRGLWLWLQSNCGQASLLVDPNHAPIEREANVSFFGLLEVSFFAAFRHRLITLRANWLARAIGIAPVRKFDFDDHSRYLTKFFQAVDCQRGVPGAIKSRLGQGGRIADVILVVLCQIGFSSWAGNCEQALQANGVDRTIPISSMRKKGRKGEDHVVASLSWWNSSVALYRCNVYQYR